MVPPYVPLRRTGQLGRRTGSTEVATPRSGRSAERQRRWQHRTSREARGAGSGAAMRTKRNRLSTEGLRPGRGDPQERRTGSNTEPKGQRNETAFGRSQPLKRNRRSSDRRESESNGNPERAARLARGCYFFDPGRPRSSFWTWRPSGAAVLCTFRRRSRTESVQGGRRSRSPSDPPPASVLLRSDRPRVAITERKGIRGFVGRGDRTDARCPTPDALF